MFYLLVCVCTVHLVPVEGTRSPGTYSLSSAAMWVVKKNRGRLLEPQVLLAIESSLQPFMKGSVGLHCDIVTMRIVSYSYLLPAADLSTSSFPWVLAPKRFSSALMPHARVYACVHTVKYRSCV